VMLTDIYRDFSGEPQICRDVSWLLLWL
jgi:hypothetical protein